MLSTRAYSASESDVSENSENTYCIFLHVVEGVGMIAKDGIGDCTKGRVVFNASLNGVKFEVEGHSTETATIFNSNCIWECELGDIKSIALRFLAIEEEEASGVENQVSIRQTLRDSTNPLELPQSLMKTDNRPVKLEFFMKSGQSDNLPRKMIGSLLLPMRGLLTISNIRNLQLKLHWHKLGALHSEWRPLKPEIYLLLTIVKKTLVESGQLESLLGEKKNLPLDLLSPQISETALMLQSKSNIYVQLLEQVGLIQVGNNPDIDCDIFNVSLTFKQLKNLEQLLERERHSNSMQTEVFVFHYDFLGSSSHLEIFVNPNDCYTINEKITLSFKSSLRSLRNYFQRIFYLPINLYLNAVAIANYRLDFSKLLPHDDYFNSQTMWSNNGSFYFDYLQKILSPRALKPSVDYIFSIQLLTPQEKKHRYDHSAVMNDTFHANTRDSKAAGDATELYRNREFAQTIIPLKRQPVDISLPLSSRNLNNFENMQNSFLKSSSESVLDCQKVTKTSLEAVRYLDPTEKQTVDNNIPDKFLSMEPDEVILLREEASGEQNCMQTTLLTENGDRKDEEHKSAATRDTDELTLKIVQELEDWKEYQMTNFLRELERKEEEYLSGLKDEWEKERSTMQQRLEARINECEELNIKLERAHLELKTNASNEKTQIEIAETVKNEVQRSYAEKFQTLEEEIKRLQMEMNKKGSLLEVQYKELQLENGKLERERTELRERINELEKTHLSANELKEVLNDLRVQTERLSEMEKSKNYYKEQWSKTTRDLHKLKLHLLQEQQTCLRESHTNNLGICLEEILTEEQDELNSDRSDLKSIKDELFVTSDTSSTCDFDDDEDFTKKHHLSLH